MCDTLALVTRCCITYMLASGHGERPSCLTLHYQVTARLLTRSVGRVEKIAQETGGRKGEGSIFLFSVQRPNNT